ncbi:MAG: carbon starvation protein A [Thermodesulfovibrionales bacterium]
MNILAVFALTVAAFLLAYRIYGRYLEKVFERDDGIPTPAHAARDSRDYVPGKWPVVFSHHFSSIAGGGPIIGPAVAIIYGFYPSWLWIVVGAVFIGSVHDFSSLFVSLRDRGKSIAEVAHNTLGRAGYLLFVAFILFMVVLVTAAFLGLTSTALSSLAPVRSLGLEEGSTLLKTAVDPATGEVRARIGGVASTSVVIITALAPVLGYLLHRRRMRVSVASALAIGVAAASIAVGLRFPLGISPSLWMVIISVYVLAAAGLPVWVVLQPRDFINSFILYAGIAALAAGIVIGGASGMAVRFPAFNIAEGGQKLGLIWPMLFITVACGAISGFHSLIASGTTSKQLSRESHAKRIALGGMLLEALLAVAVLIAIGSALDFSDYAGMVFPAEGRSNPVLAFSLGMGRMLHFSMGLPAYVGTVFGILLVEGFLVTTLDTAVRLNRYLFEELWRLLLGSPPALLRSYMFNAGLSVGLMFLFAYKQAFLSLWPIFGSSNQLMAALALITVSVWLIRRGKNAAFAILPAAFMTVTTIASLVYLLKTKYLPSGNILLVVITSALVALALGVVLLARKKMAVAKGRVPSAALEAADD